MRFWDFHPSAPAPRAAEGALGGRGGDGFALRAPAQQHEVPGFGLFHDFIATPSWFIVLAAPATWGPGGWKSLAMTLEWIRGERPVTSMIDFDRAKPTVAHFFPRGGGGGGGVGGGGVVSVPLDTFFSFHHANAFEPDPRRPSLVTFDTVRADELKVDDSSLVTDDRDDDSADGGGGGGGRGRAPPDTAATGTAADAALRGEGNRFILEDIDYARDVPRVTLMRYEVDLEHGSFTQRVLSPRHVEFPSVAPAVRGRPHRYVYSSPGPAADGVSPQSGVLKTDTADAARSQIWLPPPHQFCGEVLFTPRRKCGEEEDAAGGERGGGGGADDEDDGYLLTLCFDGA